MYQKFNVSNNPENGNFIFAIECDKKHPIVKCIMNALMDQETETQIQHKPVEDFTVSKFPVTVIESKPVTEPIKSIEQIIIPTVAPVMTAVVNEEKTHLTLVESKPKRTRRSRKEMTELRAIKDNQNVTSPSPLSSETMPAKITTPIIFTPIEPVSNAPIENVITPPVEENKTPTEPIVVPQETINQIADVSTVINDDSTPKPEYAQEALDIMIKGLKVDAVKHVKAKTGMDLASAKTYCDELWTEYIMSDQG